MGVRWGVLPSISLSPLLVLAAFFLTRLATQQVLLSPPSRVRAPACGYRCVPPLPDFYLAAGDWNPGLPALSEILTHPATTPAANGLF